MFGKRLKLKKHRFLIIAIALSILLHILMFIFAPELKSEINSNSYLKKITRISIFQEPAKPESAPKQESAPRNNGRKRAIRDNVITESRNNDDTGAPRNNVITESRNNGNTSAPRNNVITESRNNGNDTNAPRNNVITESRNNDDTSAQRDNVITESRNNDDTGAPRNNVITESRNNDDTGAQRNNVITESRNNDDTGAPRRAGELAVIPKALDPKTPPYPESLEDEGIEGSVTLELLISKEGKVLKAKVIKSDHELFSESALKTVKNYRFSAGKLKDGSAVDSLIEFVIKFEISL